MLRSARRATPVPPVLQDPHGSLLELLDRLLWLGLLGSYVPRAEPAPGSGGRPWARRLLGVDVEMVRANQQLGVRYLPMRAISNPDPREIAFDTAEDVLVALFSSGMVLAAPPRPAWALAVVARAPRPEIGWLAPRPLAPRGTGPSPQWKPGR
jgi:hypothetical protein